MSINRGIEKGDTFASFEEFQETLVSYQDQSGQKFTRTNSKTLKRCWNNGVVKDLTLDGYKPELIYFQVAYECIYSTKNTSRTKHKKTTNCNAKILLGVKDKQFLIVKNYEAIHDHLHPQTISVSNSDAASTDKETPLVEDQGTSDTDAPEIEQILKDLKQNLYSSPVNVVSEKIGHLKSILESWQKTSSSLSTNEFDLQLVDASGTLLGTLSIPACDLATQSTGVPLNSTLPYKCLVQSDDEKIVTNRPNNLPVSDEKAFAVFRQELLSDEANPIDSNGNRQEVASCSPSRSWLDISFNETGDMSTVFRAIDSSDLNIEKISNEKITSVPDQKLDAFENKNFIDSSPHESQDVGQETECPISESTEQTTNPDVRDDNDLSIAKLISGHDVNGNSSCSSGGESFYPHDSNDAKNNNIPAEIPKTATELEAPTKYSLKTTAQKIETMLRWLGIDGEVLKNVLNRKYRISKHDFDQLNPKTVIDSLIDEDVHIALLKKYFQATAFIDLRSILQSKADMNIWTCGKCQKKIMRSCIRCDSCLIWYHLKCASLTSRSTKVDWFCQICRCTGSTASE